ncbi:hypothetical protein DMH04_24270 [Kibdelosporangium aridum]|uniref:AAA family ATPase n=1 Tax=Kibdelosporangium aridum TaxID=2030 RepID=A0A428Z6B0_KIBAR|nr:AAA family ATPase [Kibdelosporangium aridum]RSM82744.1 hypothetical protein DMH04_24270 [Kibdelosporangium aridum]
MAMVFVWFAAMVFWLVYLFADGQLPNLGADVWALVIAVGLPLWTIMLMLTQVPRQLRRLPQIQGIQSPQTDQATLNRSAERPGTALSDLGGIDDAAKNLAPVISWLRTPTGQLGDNVARATLITGPSGCGKTTLAKAIAGEAGVPLFVYNGGEFHELLIGMGSARMRAAFAEARAKASNSRPCVLLIDQIDLIATARPDIAGSNPIDSGGSEAQRAMSKLLEELDDLGNNGRVYVVATTSRPRVLDSALFGPTRFDLRIDLDLPDEEQRAEILHKHLKQRPLAHTLGITDIAKGVAGFTGAELAQLVRWAVDAAKKRLLADGHPLLPDHPLQLDDFVQAKTLILPKVDTVPPARVVEHLDHRVEGQRTAKQRLGVAVSNHYLRLAAANTFTSLPTEIKKSNVLITGPTGTGKTMLIETIADYLQVPFVLGNATVLSQTGHLGTNVEQLLYQLLAAAQFNLRRAEYGIVCIDEFDKLAFNQGERTRSNGAAVQQELLKLVEGTVVEVPKSGGRSSGQASEVYQVNTRNMLFVGLGAFIGLETCVARRLAVPATGELATQALSEDLVEYGFLPELIGRFPVITATEALDDHEMVRIMGNPRNGLVTEYRTLLALHGWENPVFTDDALLRIAAEARHRGVGARALRSVMEQVLADVMYSDPASRQASRLIVDEELVERELNRTGSASPPVSKAKSLTPRKIVTALEKKVPGNAGTRELLATLSWHHYANPTDTTRNAALLVDPYLAQRRALAQALADIWGVPLAVLDADQFAEADISQWYANAVNDLMHCAGHQPAAARSGILLCDNIDRLLARSSSQSTGFLRATAPLREGRPLRFPGPDETPVSFPTAEILPIFAGSFRPAGDSSGNGEVDYSPGQLLHRLNRDYALPDGLMITVTDLRLTGDELAKAIQHHDDAIRRKYRHLLEFRHVVVTRTDEDYRALARRALDDQWNLADVPLHLETMLLEQLG